MRRRASRLLQNMHGRANMSRRLRRTLIISLQVIVFTGIGLLVYGWPFLTYPVTTLDFDFPAPLAAEQIERPYAGVAVRDLPPPIGVPKFGYSRSEGRRGGEG